MTDTSSTVALDHERMELEPVVIRQSDVESMALCPARVGYKDHPEYDSTPSEPMSFGSLVHALIEIALVQPDFVNPTSDEVLMVWREVADADGFDLDTMLDPRTLRSIALEARDALESWRTEVWPQLEYLTTKGIELQMSHEIGVLSSGRPVALQGTPDLIAVGELHDWKTGNRHYDQGKADSRIQGPSYALLAEAEFGIDIERMVYWSFKRSKGTWLATVQELTAESKAASKLALMQWAAMKEAGIYPPTPAASAGKAGRGWWCSAMYCNAWDICEYKGMIPDKVDLTIKRVRGWSS